MYKYLLKLLHHLPPETAHHTVIKFLRLLPVKNFIADIDFTKFKQTYWGLNFSHPVGLAAGFDKDAEVFDKLGQIGFSFVETGTVTPLPQPGNPRPRLFRIPEKQALINSYGFNSRGSLYAAKVLKKHSAYSVLGVNLGINKHTQHPADDFLHGIELFLEMKKADYFTINVSSPNTPGLRNLQKPAILKPIFDAIKALMKQKKSLIPLLVKLSPDISIEEETPLIEFLADNAVDGIIISNTTIRREGFENSRWASIKGGLSGVPLKACSTAMLRRVYGITQGHIPLIGCGGISSGKDAYEKLCAGANLLQIYTAFIYKGPLVLPQILTELNTLLAEKGIKNIREMIGCKTE
jgi:dihydroorotate dehydrogenase